MQDISIAKNEQIRNLIESKKEIVYVEKEPPKKIPESELAKFEKKAESLSVMCDTIGLILKTE